MEGGIAVRHQPCGKCDLHADSTWATEVATGGGGYFGHLGHNHLDVLRHLDTSQMGCFYAGVIFRVCLDYDGAAIVDHLEQLVAMIFRLSQELGTKIKAGILVETALDENPYANWSCHLFTAERTQYIILTNTLSLYSCVMYGRGITDNNTYIIRALDAIREFCRRQ